MSTLEALVHKKLIIHVNIGSLRYEKLITPVNIEDAMSSDEKFDNLLKVLSEVEADEGSEKESIVF